MKKFWKALALVGCALLLVVASVAGTYAILTSTASVSNTFTVGNVSITLDEADCDVYGVEIEGNGRVTENEYKLIPGHKYTKDPTIHVAAESEDCYLFVKVVNGISGIEAGTTIADQLEANGWEELDNETNVYYKADKVAADAEVIVFESFTLDKNADVSSYATAKIDITAYAAQADGFTAVQAWANSGFATQNNQGN